MHVHVHVQCTVCFEGPLSWKMEFATNVFSSGEGLGWLAVDNLLPSEGRIIDLSSGGLISWLLVCCYWQYMYIPIWESVPQKKWGAQSFYSQCKHLWLGAIFNFHQKTKCKATDKTLEKCIPTESKLKSTCKNSMNSNNKSDLKCI